MKGFTLIELIIYITIVSGVLIVFLNFGWEVINGNIKSQSMREVQQNSRFAMQKITENIFSAKGVNFPLYGELNNYLSLEMEDPDLNPTLFELNGDKLIITQGINGPYSLTNDRVKVASLEFINLSYLDTPGTIKIKISIKHINENNLNQYEAFLSTEDTISLRR